VAAAVAAGALALVPIRTRDDRPDDATTLAAAPDARRATKGDADAAAALDAEAGAGSTLAATPKIGDFRDYDELEGAVRQRLAPTALAASPSASPTTVTSAPVTTTTAVAPASGTGGDAAATEQAAASCPAPPPGATTSSSGDAAVVYGGAATVDGRPYTVDVTEDDAGNRTMTVRDPDADCHVVDERDL
jgi:hypothetical protein